MGEAHKLNTQVKDFILQKKKEKPLISCRVLSLLIKDELKVKISKSSINAIFKEAGLSLPSGRRGDKPRVIQPTLKSQIQAVLLPLSASPIEIKSEQPPVEPPKQEPIELPEPKPQPEPETPKIIEEPQLPEPAIEKPLSVQPFVPEEVKEIKPEPVQPEPEPEKPQIVEEPKLPEPVIAEQKSFIDGETNGEILLKAADCLLGGPFEMSRLNASLFQDARGMKVLLSDGAFFYLDAQCLTIWSTPHIPFDFSLSVSKITSYVNRCFHQGLPFNLCMAPGYEAPNPEFFDFLSAFDLKEKKISLFSLYGASFEELEVLRIDQARKQYFIFGLWPWQFVQYRKVNKFKEFKKFIFLPLKKEMYIAEVEIELTQPNVNKTVTLRGCAVKLSLNEKTRLVILSNLPLETTSPEQLTSMYLEHWPNFEEIFQDYSRKIELFTYTADSQRFFSSEELFIAKDGPVDQQTLTQAFQKTLDAYLRWHCFPSGYENKSFPSMKEAFYNLEISKTNVDDYCLVNFKTPSQYLFLEDLKYACRRLNEKEISCDGKRVWFVA